MGRATDESFVRFVDERSPELMRLALHLTRHQDEAKDLVQTSLERAYRKWSKVELEAGDGFGYVRQIMVNAHTDSLRGRQRWGRKAGMRDLDHEVVMSDGELQPVQSDRRGPETLAIQRATLRKNLALLTARERAAVVLRFGEDLPEAEVARQMGVSVGTVKSTVSRALAKLQVHAATSTPAVARGGGQ
ncbi:SigE family RNA polymerase sigma factor [Aestuariimicrobium sp. p3-SID1156]|uniref:SigE family RNA polymerase sigma factor n=1 Tax=Aestuariimicrobium sp. p3-SID1156 TaxID=2916038 RepID=UPI00223C23EF|nr:SigE family RNA polymerase sigma factor [Aestuariimicrobium sp. p3-SID1156]MCT1458208.1 SigE family RNA polymerase sigma factor [Aestuariimicrobium sp. p3-SID1156]